MDDVLAAEVHRTPPLLQVLVILDGARCDLYANSLPDPSHLAPLPPLLAQAYTPLLLQELPGPLPLPFPAPPMDPAQPPWVSVLASEATLACQIPRSPFSDLLSARTALIRSEFDILLKPPSHPVYRRLPAAAGRDEHADLPAAVVLGLTAFVAVLRSLCKERHDLEEEVRVSSLLLCFAPADVSI